MSWDPFPRREELPDVTAEGDLMYENVQEALKTYQALMGKFGAFIKAHPEYRSPNVLITNYKDGDSGGPEREE